MTLSPHERKLLEAIADGLEAEEPGLARRMAKARSARCWLPLGGRVLAGLAAVLLAVITPHVVAGDRIPQLVTGAWTVAVVLPWLLLAVRRVRAEATTGRPEVGRTTMQVACGVVGILGLVIDGLYPLTVVCVLVLLAVAGACLARRVAAGSPSSTNPEAGQDSSGRVVPD